jgi:hypothetical protein
MKGLMKSCENDASSLKEREKQMVIILHTYKYRNNFN